MRPAGAVLSGAARGGGDIPGLLAQILARLTSIQALLLSQRAGRPEPMGRLVLSHGVSADREPAPRPPAPPLELGPRALPPDDDEEERTTPRPRGAMRRRHTPESIKVDRVRMKRWLAALDMNASAAGRIAGVNPAEMYAVLAGSSGMSMRTQERLIEMLRSRGLPVA